MPDAHLHPALGPRGLLMLPLAMLPPLIASILGQLFTAPGLVAWYSTLNKPFFTPPSIVFPIVWTFLYALMAVAFWRILRAKPEAGPKREAIVVFLVQMVLNLSWSYAFFTMRSPLAGLIVITALLIAIAFNIRAFAKIDRAAGWALYPYFAWVGFAMLLNAAIFFLNR